MNPRHLLWPLLIVIAAVSGGCQMASPQGLTPVASYRAPEPREPSGESLFPSDSAVLSDEAIQKILSTPFKLPAKSKLALMRFAGVGPAFRSFGGYYWSDEVYVRLQQEQVDSLTKTLSGNPRLNGLVTMPSMMTPRDATIPILREAAVRLQADLLLLFRIKGDTFSKTRTFSKDTVKSYATCELVLLDVRTGLIPFTRIVTAERLEKKETADLDLGETMRRAESQAAAEALAGAARDLNSFLASAAVRE